jgi:hypothetical protein
MKSMNLVGLFAVSMTAFALALPVRAADSAAPTTCTDGTTSTATGKGACSGHGGIQKTPKAAAPAAPGPAAAPAPPTAPAPAAAPAAPASGATKTCVDGTTSTAAGKGACSGHGGVLKGTPAAASATAAPAATAPPATTAPTATASNTDPTGATAKCKDGTYSKSQHHAGTCSSHGGVAEWLTAQ